MATAAIPPQTSKGRGPRSPLQLSPSDRKASLKRTAKEFKADRAGLVAAGMAFYWFLAIFPALLATVALFGLLRLGSDAAEAVTRAVRSALPGDAADVLTNSLTGAGTQPKGASVIAVLTGAALAIWSASAGMVAMQGGLNVAYDVAEDRKFLKARLYAIALLLATALLGGAATALIVFGQPIGETLRDNLPFGAAFVPAWTAIRWALGLVALVILFAVFYYLGPNRDSPRWAWISPGGVVATVVWLVASLGFSLYVSKFASYGKTYGSLVGVVVLLLWLYLTALAVMLGGELNAELERQGEMTADSGGAQRAASPLPSSSSTP